MGTLNELAAWNQVDADRGRLMAMQLRPFEYVKPGGTKKIRVVRFIRMRRLLDELAYQLLIYQRQDFSDEELAAEMQNSVETVNRASADCVGRGLLKVSNNEEGPEADQPPAGKRRYQIQWDEVNRANPEANRDAIGLEWLP